MEAFTRYCSRKVSAFWHGIVTACVHPQPDNDVNFRTVVLRGQLEEAQDIINVLQDTIQLKNQKVRAKKHSYVLEHSLLRSRVDRNMIEMDLLHNAHFKQSEELEDAKSKINDLITTKQNHKRIMEEKDREIRRLVAILDNIRQRRQEDSDSEYNTAEYSDVSVENNSDEDNTSVP